MSNKPENIYDSNEFFDNYIDLRNNKNSISANEIIEMPAIYNELPDLKGKKSSRSRLRIWKQLH